MARLPLCLFAAFILALAANAVCIQPARALESSMAQVIARGFDGRWNSHLLVRETPFTSASDRHIEIRNTCHVEGSAAVCLQSVDGKRQGAIRYDPLNSHEVRISTTSPDGHSSTAFMQIHKKVWLFPWTQSLRGELVDYRIVNRFDTDNSISWSEEVRRGSGPWMRVGEGEERRVSN